jgi:glycosyltransferase involved in cell wall biosynthesis
LTSSGTESIESFRLIPAYFKRILKSIFLRFDDKPDVIVCCTHMPYDSLPGLILQFRFRAMRVVYVHHIIGKHSDHRRGILSRISILAEKISLPLIRSANIVFVVNEDVKSDLIEMGFDPAKIRISSNGLDYRYISSINPTDSTRYDGCFCGRLVKTKGVYDLIEIWKLVTIHHPNSRLVIVGDGPEYTSLSNKIKEMNLVDNIKLTGYISERDKFLIMKRSKVFVFPSYEEGWGIAVTEAIACGLDVVLYDIGAYKAVGKHAIAVEKSNTNKMAEIIINLIERESHENIKEKKSVRIESVLDWQEVAKKELLDIEEIVHR